MHTTSRTSTDTLVCMDERTLEMEKATFHDVSVMHLLNPGFQVDFDNCLRPSAMTLFLLEFLPSLTQRPTPLRSSWIQHIRGNELQFG